MASSFQLLDPARGAASAQPEAMNEGVDAGWLTGLVQRRWRLFLAVVSTLFVATAIFTFLEKPVYTAGATVLIDAQRLQLFSAEHDQAVTAGAGPDSNSVDTQVEVMRSREIADRVARSLSLDRDPDFLPKDKRHGVSATLATILRPFARRPGDQATVAPSAEAVHDHVVDKLLKSLDVRRVSTTYVIQINYTWPSATKAAAIANAFAQEYLADAIGTKQSATREASGLLSSRLVELSDNAARDAAAVQQYKIAHGLLSASGATLIEQEISNYNQQLATAKAQAAEDEARLRTAQAQLAHGSEGDDVGEALTSPVIQSLRAQRAVASGQVAQLSARYGPRYPDMLKVQRQLADLDVQIRSEIERIISNLQANAEVSRQRVASMQQTLSGARGTLAGNGRDQVELTLLERRATASQTLYDSYLNRFKETSTQEGTEQSGARIVSRAETPTEPSAPKVGLYLGFGAILAIGAGVAAMLAAEALETGLMTPEDVERRLGLSCLGVAPNLTQGSMAGARSPWAYLAAWPLSPFAEAFRNLRAALSHSGGGEDPGIWGITSPSAGEGKTTTAACLAAAAAMQGRRVVVVDCDLRGRSLSAQVAGAPQIGFVEVLKGASAVEAALVHDPATGAAFLPVSQAPPPIEDVFSGAAFNDLLEDLRKRFDLVILDMPSVLTVSDARVLAPKCDVVLLLAQWRRTPQQAVREALRVLRVGGSRVAGLALTRVGMQRRVGGSMAAPTPAASRLVGGRNARAGR